LTQQMVEALSCYGLKCQFMSALNRTTAKEVARLGYNLETHSMAELLEAA